MITCEDCGAQTEAFRKNTKYCAFHRFYRAFMFVRRAPQPVKCQMCDKHFLPTQRGVVICARCYPPPDSFGIDTCYICKRPGPKVNRDVAVCGPCSENPANQQAMLKLLAHKDSWLKRQNQSKATDEDEVPAPEVSE